MKIRTGFVSNSSSSSFVVFNREVDFDEITKEMIKTSKAFAYGEDYCYGEGSDYFELDMEMFIFLQTHTDQEGLKFFEVYKMVEDSGEFSLADLNLPPDKKFVVESIAIGYHCCTELKDMKERYFKDED